MVGARDDSLPNQTPVFRGNLGKALIHRFVQPCATGRSTPISIESGQRKFHYGGATGCERRFPDELDMIADGFGFSNRKRR